MRRCLGLLAVLALTACAGSPELTGPGSRADDPAWQNAQEFTQAVWSNDLAAARPLVAPGTAAERYLDYTQVLLSATSSAGSGDGAAPGGSLTLTIDHESGSITDATPGGTELVWRDFTYADELVSGWLVGDSDTPLAQRLWTQDSQAAGDVASAELAGAYRNDAGLWVVARVTAGDRPVLLDEDAAYLSDAVELAATLASVPARIEPGEAGLVAFGFDGADLGGRLRLSVAEPSAELLLPIT